MGQVVSSQRGVIRIELDRAEVVANRLVGLTGQLVQLAEPVAQAEEAGEQDYVLVPAEAAVAPEADEAEQPAAS